MLLSIFQVIDRELCWGFWLAILVFSLFILVLPSLTCRADEAGLLVRHFGRYRWLLEPCRIESSANGRVCRFGKVFRRSTGPQGCGGRGRDRANQLDGATPDRAAPRRRRATSGCGC